MSLALLPIETNVLQVSLNEYLSNDYSPDCDFVDGEVLERNMGERDHSRLQALLTAFLVNHEKEFGIFVFTEQRVQTGATRYRVPDILVSLDPIAEQILTKPPFLCIEILSPEDRVTRMQTKIREFFNFGVKYVWTIDPGTRQAFIHTSDSVTEVSDGFLRTKNPEIIVPLLELK